MTIYAKPAVRASWGQTASGADLVDPGNTYASAGYQLGVKPPRQYDNWVYNWTTAAVRYFCQQGISDWDGAETYATNGIVQGSDNNLYQAIQASTNINPVGGTAGYWGPVKGAAPANNDNSNSLSTTAWVTNNFLAKGSTFAAISGSIANGQVPVGVVTQWQGSLSIGGGQVTSAVNQANNWFLGTANRYVQPQWSGQAGQPSWLFGSNDGVNLLVWNPSNFNVANANTVAGLAVTSAAAGNTVAARDVNGYLNAIYLNQASGNNENPSISQVMVTNGGDNFLRKASVAALASALGAFTSSNSPFGSGGYQKFLSGGIIQGGRVTVNGTTNVFFPIAFPNHCFGVAFTNEGSTNQIFLNSPPSQTFFQTANGNAVINWIAFGY